MKTNKAYPSQVLQQKLRDLDRAFREGFDKRQPLKHIPVFKKRGSGDGIRFPQGFKIENRRIFLPKIGWVGFYKSNSIEGKVKNITISNRAGRWYASIQVEQMMDIREHSSDTEIGIDAGIKCFAAFSDGTMVQGVNSFRKHEETLAREQKKLSRKQKGSNNWKKQRKRISRLHQKIGDVRKDILHKISTQICKSHALTVGQTGMACGSNRISGRKQEPAGNRKEVLFRAC